MGCEPIGMSFDEDVALDAEGNGRIAAGWEKWSTDPASIRALDRTDRRLRA